jgi:hypothetical protein
MMDKEITAKKWSTKLNCFIYWSETLQGWVTIPEDEEDELEAQEDLDWEANQNYMREAL